MREGQGHLDCSSDVLGRHSELEARLVVRLLKRTEVLFELPLE